MAAHRAAAPTPPHGLDLATRRHPYYREIRAQFLASLGTGALAATFLALVGVL